MREIKFRSYYTDKFIKEYIDEDVDPIDKLTSSEIHYKDGVVESRMTSFEKIDDINADFELQNKGCLIMTMYTGLKDKNGIEIYEGDILQIFDPIIGRNTPIYEVNYNNLIATYELNDPKNQTYEFLNFSKANQMTVIGNIHQNPELLNK